MLDKQPQQCASNGQLQKQQQQQQAGTRAPGFAGTSSASSGASAAGAWGLSPSGAASSWGAAHSKLLDLFADVTEEDVVVTRCDTRGGVVHGGGRCRPARRRVARGCSTG
jgi:hypothetical protein